MSASGMTHSKKAAPLPLGAMTAVAVPLLLSLLAARVLMPPVATTQVQELQPLPDLELLEDFAGASLERRDPDELSAKAAAPPKKETMRREVPVSELLERAEKLKRELLPRLELEALAGRFRAAQDSENVAIALVAFIMLGLVAALVDHQEMLLELEQQADEVAAAAAAGQPIAAATKRAWTLLRCIVSVRRALAMVPGVTLAKGVVLAVLAVVLPVVLFVSLRAQRALQAVSGGGGVQDEMSSDAQNELASLAGMKQGNSALDESVMVGLAACAMIGVAAHHCDAFEMQQQEASEE